MIWLVGVEFLGFVFALGAAYERARTSGSPRPVSTPAEAGARVKVGELV